MITSIIKNLLDQTVLLPSEKVVILDQFYNLSAEEEIAWLDFLNANPNFFEEVAYNVRNVETAARYQDAQFLNKFFNNLTQELQKIGEKV